MDWYLHRLDWEQPQKYKTLRQMIDIVGVQHTSRLQYYYKKNIIWNGYAINHSAQIDWNEYTEYEVRHSKLYNQFYEEQDFYATVERGVSGFDSVTGIDKAKLERYKPNYRLNEEEAKQQGLEQILDGGRLYINPTKQIYVKDQNGYYYQLLMM